MSRFVHWLVTPRWGSYEHYRTIAALLLFSLFACPFFLWFVSAMAYAARGV